MPSRSISAPISISASWRISTAGRSTSPSPTAPGQSLAADDIGNLISEQEIFGGGQNFRLAELSYQQSLFDDQPRGKARLDPRADDFATSPIYCYFQNNGFCGQPAGIPIDSGVTTFPVASWGGVVKLRPQPDLYLQAGAYEVNPSLNNRATASR